MSTFSASKSQVKVSNDQHLNIVKPQTKRSRANSFFIKRMLSDILEEETDESGFGSKVLAAQEDENQITFKSRKGYKTTANKPKFNSSKFVIESAQNNLLSLHKEANNNLKGMI